MVCENCAGHYLTCQSLILPATRVFGSSLPGHIYDTGSQPKIALKKMRVLIVAFNFIFIANAWSADQASTNQVEQVGKKLLDTAECAFVSAPISDRRREDPTMLKVSPACGDKNAKPLYQCRGLIYCVSTLSAFYIQDAKCWSTKDFHCPSPNVCAKETFFNSVAKSIEPVFPHDIYYESPTPAVQ